MKKMAALLLLSVGYFLSYGQTNPADIDPERVNDLIHFCDSTMADGIQLAYKGNIIADWKRAECDSSYMNTASMVKSWTGLVVGILIDQKIIDSLNTPVCKYIPEWKAGCENRITVRHLLTMTAGINKTRGGGILSQKDMNSYAVGIIPDTLPDIRFSYSNESVQLLGIIIERATGKQANEVFHEVLFSRLGMDSSKLVKDSAGNDIVYGGCTTTVGDAMKIGLMMLDHGKYNGEQIVSESWVTSSVTPGRLAPYYGYLWWIDTFSPDLNFAATGDLGQLTIVYPDLDLVFVRMQNCDQSRDSQTMRWMGPAFLKLIADVRVRSESR